VSYVPNDRGRFTQDGGISMRSSGKIDIFTGKGELLASKVRRLDEGARKLNISKKDGLWVESLKRAKGGEVALTSRLARV